MTEYAFSNGKVRVECKIALGSGRWQPHAYKPAFIILDSPCGQAGQDMGEPPAAQPEEAHDGKTQDH